MPQPVSPPAGVFVFEDVNPEKQNLEARSARSQVAFEKTTNSNWKQMSEQSNVSFTDLVKDYCGRFKPGFTILAPSVVKDMQNWVDSAEADPDNDTKLVVTAFGRLMVSTGKEADPMARKLAIRRLAAAATAAVCHEDGAPYSATSLLSKEDKEAAGVFTDEERQDAVNGALAVASQMQQEVAQLKKDKDELETQLLQGQEETDKLRKEIEALKQAALSVAQTQTSPVKEPELVVQVREAVVNTMREYHQQWIATANDHAKSRMALASRLVGIFQAVASHPEFKTILERDKVLASLWSIGFGGVPAAAG